MLSAGEFAGAVQYQSPSWPSSSARADGDAAELPGGGGSGVPGEDEADLAAQLAPVASAKTIA